MLPTRRSLLSRLTLGAGAVVLDPLVRQLDAQAAGSPARPTRFLFVMLPNGCPATEINPVDFPLLKLGSRQGLTVEPIGDRKLHPSMAAVEKYKKKVTVLQGVSGTCANCPGAEESLGGHSKAWSALGAFMAMNNTVPAATVDWALGRKLGGLFTNICLGVSKDPSTSIVYDMSAAGPGRKNPTLCHPAIAYKALFGGVAGGQAAREFAVRTNLLDFLAEDVRAIRAAVGAAERDKLEAHLDAYEAMRGRQSKFEAHKERLQKHLPPVTDKFTSKVETDRLTAQFDLAAAALAGGLTHSVVVSCAGGRAFDSFVFTGLGIDIGLHGIGHNKPEVYLGSMQTIRTYIFEQIASVMKKLEAIPEGNGTMLDNTLIVFTSDFGENHHAQTKEWPFVLIGDLGGRVKSGNVLVYPPWGHKGHKALNNLYTTLMYTVGEQPKTFGTPDVKLKDLDMTGPLQELLG
ncbi:DUF1552 domain-containing protein [Gemmata sp.]|uniref:DUF1552 domain-containing protein n=1 Tax=Gemmata sp. TaxID=1914242 RepID=UPI003F6EE056